MEQSTHNTDQSALLVKTVLHNWNLQNERMDTLLDQLSDEDLARETAPGRNTGNLVAGPSHSSKRWYAAVRLD